MVDQDLTLGQRVARARRRAGMDQATLAGLVGRSASWMSKVERGDMPLDRMSVIASLAEALDVEVVELTGQPYRHERADLDSGHAAVPALRQVMQRLSLPPGLLPGAGAPRPLAELRVEVEKAERLRQAAHFTPLADFLPALIDDLDSAWGGSPARNGRPPRSCCCGHATSSG